MRPSDLGVGGPNAPIRARLGAIERAGPDERLHVGIDGADPVAVIPGQAIPAAGAIGGISLTTDPAKAHYDTPETGARMLADHR